MFEDGEKFINGEGVWITDALPEDATTTKFVIELSEMTSEAAKAVMAELLADNDSHLGYLLDRVTGTTRGHLRIVEEIN